MVRVWCVIEGKPMEHEITRSLGRLDPPLANEEEVTILISGVHRNVTPLPDPKRIHGFAMIARFATGRDEETFSYLSRTETTTHMRAELGALMTALQWLHLNADHVRKREVLGKVTYVVNDLPRSISEWVQEKKSRPNLDLLKKIRPLLERDPHVDVRRYANATELDAVDDARRLARIKRDAVTIESYAALPSEDFDFEYEMNPDDEARMLEAMRRDTR